MPGPDEGWYLAKNRIAAVRRVIFRATAANTCADNDKIAAVFEARLAWSEAHADKKRRRHIEVLADSFSGIANRMLALRGIQAGQHAIRGLASFLKLPIDNLLSETGSPKKLRTP